MLNRKPKGFSKLMGELSEICMARDTANIVKLITDSVEENYDTINLLTFKKCVNCEFDYNDKSNEYNLLGKIGKKEIFKLNLIPANPESNITHFLAGDILVMN